MAGAVSTNLRRERAADPTDLTFPGRPPTKQGSVPLSVATVRPPLGVETVSSDEKRAVHTHSPPLAKALTVGNLSHSSSCRHCVVMESARQARRDLEFLHGEGICNGWGQEQR